jgi:DNA repair protein RecO (recombination protein O)
MIIRTPAIPLSCYPYSSTSRIVHWLTRGHGKISTLLKGALRPKSPFLGEYELFSTSELLYYPKRAGTLHIAKECALIHPRPSFRNNWRSTLAASYITSIFSRITPEETPQPGQFEFFEELIDHTEAYGNDCPSIAWLELKFCDHQGQRPNLGGCIFCSSERVNRFSTASGGVVCASCAQAHKLPTLDCPPDILAILRSWQRADHPRTVIKTRLTEKQKQMLNALLGSFMAYHFNLPPESRFAALGI